MLWCRNQRISQSFRWFQVRGRAVFEGRPVPKRRVDTTRGGVHSHFVRQCRVFDKTRANGGHVGKLFPISNKEKRCPHVLDGAVAGGRIPERRSS